MKTRLFIFIIALMVFGSYCKAQDLQPEQDSNGKYGYIDKTGKEVIPLIYDGAETFSDEFARVKLNGN